MAEIDALGTNLLTVAPVQIYVRANPASIAAVAAVLPATADPAARRTSR